jgi:hypothetical protein
VVVGPRLAIAQVLARGGWTLTPAVVARLNRALRPGVAAGGRRVNPLGPGAAGGRDQGALCQVSHPCGVPHARLRPPWPVPAVTTGRGAAKGGRPWTPALAAGLTDHVWTRPAVRLDRVPPWPQPQTVSHRRPVAERGVEGLRVRRDRPRDMDGVLQIGCE